MEQIKLAIILPLYNDWDSFTALVPELDKCLAREDLDVSLIVVNDASSVGGSPAADEFTDLKTIRQIDIVHLACNLGHQRAIAVGLVEVSRRMQFDAVVIMDADGEDRPEDVSRLLDRFQKSNGKEIIVAGRGRRSEGLLFRAGYLSYKLVFRLLTGQSIVFGNFSLIPSALLNRITFRDSLWNHLPATILRSKLPFTVITSDRGSRLKGSARMNTIELIVHGLSGISVFAERAFLRIAFILLILTLTIVSGIIAVTGWFSGLTAYLLVLLILSAIISILVFIILAGRSGPTGIPAKFALEFVERTETIFDSGNNR